MMSGVYLCSTKWGWVKTYVLFIRFFPLLSAWKTIVNCLYESESKLSGMQYRADREDENDNNNSKEDEQKLTEWKNHLV